MKLKKLLALALSLMLALTMLTACGGGRSNIVNTGEVESILAGAGMDVDVGKSGELNRMVNSAADMVEKRSYSSNLQDEVTATINGMLSAGQRGACALVTEATLTEASITADMVAAYLIYNYSLGNSNVCVLNVTTADGVPCVLIVALAD